MTTNQHHLPIHMLLLHVIKNCNSPCVTCDCWKTRGLTQLTMEQIETSARAFAEGGGELVMVSGGEPLLRKDIKNVLMLLKNLGLQISLNTNGLLIKRRFDDFDGLCDFIVVSVDAASRKLYERIRGVDGLESVIEAVSFLREKSQAKIQFRCTISHLNLSEFMDVIDLGRHLGISGVGLSPIDHDSESFGRAPPFLDSHEKLQLLPNYDEIQKFRADIDGDLGKRIDEAYLDNFISWDRASFRKLADYFEWGWRHDDKKSLPSKPCFFPYSAALVDYDGSVRPCFYTKPYIKAECLTSKMLRDPAHIAAVEAEGKCSTCRGRIIT